MIWRVYQNRKEEARAAVVGCKIPRKENSPIFGFFSRPPLPVSPGSPEFHPWWIKTGAPAKIGLITTFSRVYPKKAITRRVNRKIAESTRNQRVFFSRYRAANYDTSHYPHSSSSWTVGAVVGSCRTKRGMRRVRIRYMQCLFCIRLTSQASPSAKGQFESPDSLLTIFIHLYTRPPAQAPERLYCATSAISAGGGMQG